jgi:hypothetical protein
MRIKALTVFGFFLVAGGACGDKKFDVKKKAAEQVRDLRPALPAGFRLDLPTAPIVVKKPDVPVQYADGSFSVYGLLAKKKEILGKDVRVSAFVVELNAPKKRKCPPSCTPPHLYLADAAKPADDAQRLLVADFTPQQVKKIQTGERYRFTGKFQTTSVSQFSRAEGLLSFNGAQPP